MTDKKLIRMFEKADYERLKLLEAKGFQDYQDMFVEGHLTEGRVLAFINQLSPWNLETTGRSVLRAYIEREIEKSKRKVK